MTSLEIPKPENWQDFEKISTRLAKKIYKNTNAQRYGRQGQNQNGVDILIDSEEGIIGIQCKRVEKLTLSEISKEIKKAEKFTPRLNSFKLYTTINRDTEIQSYIAEKSQEYRDRHLFDIEILMWEDISEKLQEINNYDILEDFYPEYFYADVNISNILDVLFEKFNNKNYIEVENMLDFLNNTEIHFNNKNASKFHFIKGKYYELCNQYNNAGKEYFEAYEHQSSNSELKFYHVLGLYFIGEIEKSKKICKNLLKENCDEDIYALSVFLNNINDKDVINEFKSSDKVIYSLILNAYKQRNYSHSLDLFEKIEIEDDVKKSINYCMIKLAYYKNKNFSFNIDYMHDMEFNEIENILQTSIDSLSDKIFINYLNQFYALLDLNYKLNHENQLKRNIERGLKVDPENCTILYFEGLYLHKKGDEYGSINILKGIMFDLPEAFKDLSLILIEKKDYAEIIKLGEELLIKLDNDSDNYIFCCDVLVNAYLNKNEKYNAEKIVNSMNNIPYKYLLMSKLSKNISDKEKYLNKCFENVNSFESHHKLILAGEYMKINIFQKAISIYESCLNTKIYSPYLEDLMYCYYYNNTYKKIIEISEYFISKKEFHSYFLELEIELYLKINDYAKVISLIELYQKEFENNLKIELAYAKINLIIKKYDEVDLFLNKNYSIENLSIYQCIDLYELYKLREYPIQKILDLLYDIRLYHSQNYDWIHEWYIVEILQLNIDFKKPEYVDYETGISVKFINNSQDLFLLKNNNIKYKLNEFNNFDSMRNHKIGDTVQIDKFGNKIEIIDIYNKYKFAFDESYKNLDFKKTKGLKQISVDDSLESIFQVAKERSDRIFTLSNDYKDNKLFISMFSKLFGKDIYDTYFYLKTIGIKSFSYKEKRYGINNRVILDITSVFTIHSLKIEDLIKDNYTLFISHKTLNELNNILKRTKHENNRESMNVFEEDGELYRQDSNYEYKILEISKIIKWIKSNCKTQPSKKLFELNDEQYKIINYLKEYNYEDILLAMDNKCLVSDDLILKEIFKEPFHIETCGTLNLIDNLFYNKKINQDRYNELISQLFIENYRDVPISVELIKNMIQKGEYRVLIKFLIKSHEYPNFEALANQLIESLNKNNKIETICYQMIINTLFNHKFKNSLLSTSVNLD